ncbi:hypothetical protein [Vibrio coralliilyticus]|uniref:hypothetical protein n=1 Tax=Vibrio coralliilyticus TaxID=190893 RepID=UPI001E58A08B|nr:hypothetical protein [Vibrio coralliilyticus]
MLMTMADYIGLHFGGKVNAYSEFCGIPYSTCAKHAKDTRLWVEVAPHGSRVFKLEGVLEPRAYDVHYDRFNPYFFTFGFCGLTYHVLESRASDTPTYLFSSIASNESVLDMLVEKSPHTSFVSFVFVVKSSRKAVLELIADEQGAFIILQPARTYEFFRGNERLDAFVAHDFRQAVELCSEEGLILKMANTVVYPYSS